jgi:uncharacterized protein YjbI with pentapeptide repeats
MDFTNSRGSLIELLETIPLKNYSYCNFSGVDLSTKNFTGFEFSWCTFSSSNMASTNLSLAKFVSCKLSKMDSTQLESSNLVRTSFTECTIDGCDFSSTPQAIVSSYWGSCKINTSFDECNLENVNFHYCKFVACSFNSSMFWHTLLTSAEWDQVDASFADMRGMNLLSCKFKSCIFEFADLSNVLFDPSRVESSSFKDAKLVRSTYSAPGGLKKLLSWKPDIIGQTVYSVLGRQPTRGHQSPASSPSAESNAETK